MEFGAPIEPDERAADKSAEVGEMRNTLLRTGDAHP